MLKYTVFASFAIVTLYIEINMQGLSKNYKVSTKLHPQDLYKQE